MVTLRRGRCEIMYACQPVQPAGFLPGKNMQIRESSPVLVKRPVLAKRPLLAKRPVLAKRTASLTRKA
jgi:hypothetical protein